MDLTTEQKISDLLVYIPPFGVLICRACQFAVQPSAFSSHLLRHHIYRNERRKLLEELHSLAIAEPEEVDVPPPTTQPVPYIPVYRGLVCESFDCNHACVSEKRMAQHWSLVHGKPNAMDVRARPAHLQTFFRGNKNRYFEVSSASNGVTPAGSEDSMSMTNSSAELKDILRDYRRGLNSPMDFNNGPLKDDTAQSKLDMTPLKLLHHYCMSTYRTISRGTEPASFWAHDAVLEAFKHEFVMNGILAVSAFHLLRTTTEQNARTKLYQAAVHYQEAGLAEFQNRLKQHSAFENSISLLVFARLLTISRCAEAQLDSIDGTLAPGLGPLTSLLEFFFCLRGGTELLLESQSKLPESHVLRLPQNVLSGLDDVAWKHRAEIERMSGKDSIVLPPRAWYPDMPAALYETILSIPLKLVLYKPEDSPELMDTIDDAVLSLLIASNRSYESDGLWALWNGLESWPRGLPEALKDTFIGMVEAKKPAVLFLYAHWCLLVRRMEKHYWYMEGHSDRLLEIIFANLDGEPARLVAELQQMPT